MALSVNAAFTSWSLWLHANSHKALQNVALKQVQLEKREMVETDLLAVLHGFKKHFGGKKKFELILLFLLHLWEL